MKRFNKFEDAVRAAREWVEEMTEYEHDLVDIPLDPISREEGGMPIFKVTFKETPDHLDFKDCSQDGRFEYFVVTYEGDREAEVLQCTAEGDKPIGHIGRWGRSDAFHKLAR